MVVGRFRELADGVDQGESLDERPGAEERVRRSGDDPPILDAVRFVKLRCGDLLNHQTAPIVVVTLTVPSVRAL
jgi:hypothetical protein